MMFCFLAATSLMSKPFLHRDPHSAPQLCRIVAMRWGIDSTLSPQAGLCGVRSPLQRSDWVSPGIIKLNGLETGAYPGDSIRAKSMTEEYPEYP